MRIIFMGNPEFAVPTLDQISQSKHQILYVVSNPPKRIGRGRKIKETAVGIAARSIGIPLLQPNKLDDIHFLRYISSMQPDIFVVVAYKILPNRLLSIPKFGAINLHPSKLPKYRGAAPIQWSLLNGDKETAVTTISLSQEIDSGKIMLQEIVDIQEDDDFGSLYNRLSRKGAELVVRTLDGIERGQIKGIKQDALKVSFAPKIQIEDLKIDWNKSAIEIKNQIRAFSPYPGGFTTLMGKRLKIFSVTVHNNNANKKYCGQVINIAKDELIVQTGDGQLALNVVQSEGKKRMDIELFLQGVDIPINTILGDQ